MNPWISTLLLIGCAGCVAPSHILQHDGQSMVDRMRASDQSAKKRFNFDLVPSLDDQKTASALMDYSRTASNEIHQLFPTLPNPTIRVYIYPHLSTRHRAPVPGYTTAIPLYERSEFALPEEIFVQKEP